VTGNSVEQLIRIALGFFLLLSQQPLLPHQGGQLLGALLEAMWQNPQARRLLLEVRKSSPRVFGLNIFAEAQFNTIFDNWISGHKEDVV
jgi:hypothetical protein